MVIELDELRIRPSVNSPAVALNRSRLTRRRLEMIGCLLLSNLLSGGFYISRHSTPVSEGVSCIWWITLSKALLNGPFLWSRFVCGDHWWQILALHCVQSHRAAVSWSTHGDKQLERAPIWVSTKVAMWAATLRIHLLLWDLKMISDAKPLIECLLTCRI